MFSSLLAANVDAAAPAPAPAGAFATGVHRNLFAELLGKKESALDWKLDRAWHHFFAGNNRTQRLYFPVGDDMAYIADTGNGDVRSEGMSYGMMIAVQMDRRAEFDRLWRWAKAHMHHAAGPRRGYFAWQCAFDGRPIDPGSASDGEEWFAMALFFAAHRWGNPPADSSVTAATPPAADAGATADLRGGAASPFAASEATSAARRGESSSPHLPAIDYTAEAQALLRAMRDNARGGGITAIFHPEHRQVVFAPTLEGYAFTDPSYHLPAFYELWARWDADAGGRAFWAEAAKTSREFLRRAAHPHTGLMPEYANFDGTPRPGYAGEFHFDAWRTPGNVGLDHAWFAADPWQVGQANRVLRFFASQGPNPPNQFTLEGRPLSSDTSVGMVAMAAVAGLAADPQIARPFVERLWDAELPTGQYRYYDGLLYFLGFLEAGGRFKIYAPQ